MKYVLLLFIFSTCSPSVREQENDLIKINWLTNIKTTARISSDHYSDFVLDKNGNSYIACFFTENSVDYIYIAKISPDGKTVWEMDKSNNGRATAIAIDIDENIWVTGFYSGLLDFGEKTDDSSKGSSLFLAKFNKEGKCLQIISSSGDAIGYNVHSNIASDLILWGVYGDTLTLGGKSLKSENNSSDNYFIAYFDKNRTCLLLKDFPGYVSRIRSDGNGELYVTGRFNKPFKYNSINAITENNFDNDGFLLKINLAGNIEWFKQYGKIGNSRYGYRSNEGFYDMVIENNGNITVAASSELSYAEPGLELMEEETSLKTAIITFDKNGTILKEKVIAQHANEGSLQTLVKNTKGQYFLTFSAKQGTVVEGKPISFTGDFRSVIIKYDSDWNLMDMLYPADETDAIFRVANSFGNNVFYSGHYRNEIIFGENKIQNDGRHSLFMMKIE